MTVDVTHEPVMRQNRESAAALGPGPASKTDRQKAAVKMEPHSGPYYPPCASLPVRADRCGR